MSNLFKLKPLLVFQCRTGGLLPNLCAASIKSHTMSSDNTSARKAKILSKLLGGKKKKRYSESAGLGLNLTKNSAGFSEAPKPSKETSRRAHVLNAVFMGHVTDVMSVGDIGAHLQGYGIEITRVKVSCDYTFLNVYWHLMSDTDPERVDLVEKLLTSLSGKIRHVLSCLRVIGHIPKIVFVRDKEQNYLVELEQRLAVADFGPEEEESKPGNFLTIEQQRLSDEEAKPQWQNDGTLPPVVSDMRQDIYKLNHSRMMLDVLQLRKKMEAAHRNNPNCPYVFHECPKLSVASTEGDSYASNESNLAKVQEFVKARKLHEAKMIKQQKMAEREIYNQIEVTTADYEDAIDEEDDYVDDSSDFYKADNYGISDKDYKP